MSFARDNSDLQNQLASKIKENNDLKNKILTLETELKTEKINKEALNKKINEFSGHSVKSNPIKMEDVSIYFKNVIDSFEKNLKTSKESSVDYVIGNMDVELKTQVSSDDKGNAIIITPDPANPDVGKESLSTIRFSIKPIPKEPIK